MAEKFGTLKSSDPDFDKSHLSFSGFFILIMARKKIIKSGFHLKYIPAGRLSDLQRLAESCPIKDKTIALTKYVETLSSIIERCWNNDEEFVGVSQRMLKEILGIESTLVSKILKDLIEEKFIQKNGKDFKVGEVAWKYKALYTELNQIVFHNNKLNKKTNSMMNTFNTDNLSKDLNCYYKVLSKIKFNKEIYNYITKYTTKDTCIYCNSLVPYEHNVAHECNSLVPYEVTGKIPTELIPVMKLLAGKFRISRPVKNSRVYTNITNLSREYRPLLTLNDKSLIGFDIANSQPLLATIVFQMFSKKEYGYIKPDVLAYQKNCEAGKFYEYFMELNNVDIYDEDIRGKFKGEFFGKIFYSKNLEEENYLKTQFKEKYPTCFEAIFTIKGNKFYSEEYKEFPALMTELETHIMWNTNLEVINQGYDMVNIFDSLYSDDETAVTLAKRLVIEKFKDFGITPTLKDIDYRNHAENLALADSPSPLIQQTIKNNKTNKMKNEELKNQSIEKINAAIKQLNDEGTKINEANIIKVSGLGRSTVQRIRKNDSSMFEKMIHPQVKNDSPKMIHLKNDSPEQKMIHLENDSSINDSPIIAQPETVTPAKNDSPTQEEINLVRQFYLIKGEEVSKKEIMKLTNLPSAIVHQCMSIIEEDLVPDIIDEEKTVETLKETLQEPLQSVIKKENPIQQSTEQKVINDHERFKVNPFNPNKQDIYEYYGDLLFKYTGERRKKQDVIEEPKEEIKYLNPYLKAV